MTNYTVDALSEARAAWSAGDIARAERAVRSASDADPVDVHELLADVAYAREDVAAAIDELAAAVDATRPHDTRLPRILARLAQLAAQTVSRKAMDVVSPRLATCAATDESEGARVAAQLWLARFTLLDGDPTTAWAQARTAEAVATSDAARGAIALTQAHILHAADDVFGPEILSREAAPLITAADADGGLQGPLREIVLDLATADAAIARDLIERATARERARRPGPLDRFAAAAEYRLHGTIARANGRRIESHRHLERAFVVYDTGDFVAITASIALDLVEDARHEYHRDATEICRLIPRSWLAQRAARAASGSNDERVGTLTPAQRDVLFALCAGKAAKTIAADFDRSPFTIRNHTKEVFRVFNVRSRGMLIAECARAGIYPPRDGARIPRPRRRAAGL